MVKNIEQEYPPGGRTLADHIDVFSKGLVIIRLIDRRISVAFFVVIERDLFITNQLFEIIPVPFSIRRPVMRQVSYDQGYARFIKLFPENFRLDRINNSDRF